LPTFRLIIHLLASLLTAIHLTPAVVAQPLPALQPEERSEWAAVGVVSSRGSDGTSICSGTLVAQDLVITAAHCTTNKQGLLDSILFTAGKNGARLAATSSSVEVIRHPVWAYASGATKLKFDIAVIRLGRLITPDKVRPIALVPAESSPPEKGALLGYQDSAEKSLHGSFDCSLSPAPEPGVIASDCQVTGGNSGGALLVRGDHGWQLAGVLVAHKNPEGTALAAEVNDWLRRHVKAALQREERRSLIAK
jgi:hypothetical protein